MFQRASGKGPTSLLQYEDLGIVSTSPQEAVRRNVEEARSAESPPFSLVDFAEKKSIAEPAIQSEKNDNFYRLFSKQTHFADNAILLRRL